MNFYQDGRACVMVGKDGAVHCGQEGSEIEFKVEEK